MKVYKLTGLDIYITAYSKEDAVLLLWMDKIGATVDNIGETNIKPNPDNIGKVFRNVAELINHSID